MVGVHAGAPVQLDGTGTGLGHHA
ncbi:hypothetical protein MGSAQ_002833, partial [marine sediment metagenome]